MKYFHLLLLSIGVFTSGCVNVPKTKISGTIAGAPFSIEAPKDGELTGLKLTANTNGTVSLSIEKLSVKMNPDVVAQSAAGQVQIIKASMEGAGVIAGTVSSSVVGTMMHGGVPAIPSPVPAAPVQ